MKTSYIPSFSRQVTVTETPSDGTTSSSSPSLAYWHQTEVLNGVYHGGKNRVIPNPFTFDIVKAGWGHYNRYYSSVINGEICNVITSGPAMPPLYTVKGLLYTSPDWTMVENSAMAKIYDQLRGNNNLIVDLAEGSQTLRMVKNVLNLKKFVKEFLTEVIRHPKYKSMPKGPTQGQRRLDYINGKWLEYRYGWTPLIGSIYDAADNLNKDLSHKTIYVKGRSGNKRNIKSFTLPSDGAYDRKAIVDYSCSFRVEYGMLFNMPGGPAISDWTSLNPIGIAYELMTLSFVIDWVADIGGYLSLWENNALFSKHFAGGYVTRSYKETYTFTHNYYQYIRYIWDSNGMPVTGSTESWGRHANCVRVGKDRVRLSSLPVPAGVTVKVRFGWKHQLDLAALFQQLVGRKHR